MAQSRTAYQNNTDEQSTTRPKSLVLLISTVGAEGVIGQVLSSLPRSTTSAFIVFTDVRKGFSALLCDRLRSECSLHVEELSGSKQLKAGAVYVVPSQFGVEFTASSNSAPVEVSELAIPLGSGEAATRIKDSCKKAVEVFGSSSIAVMLSGMAGDAVEAVSAVRQGGGKIVAQNEATSLVFDGPRSVVDAGFAHDILPLWAISARVAEILEEMP